MHAFKKLLADYAALPCRRFVAVTIDVKVAASVHLAPFLNISAKTMGFILSSELGSGTCAGATSEPRVRAGL